jgi:hypothetical protein
MPAFWRMTLRELPAFNDGFVVQITALPREDHCRYEIRHGSSLALELNEVRPLSVSGEVPRTEGDAILRALLAASVSAIPEESLGGMDGVNYTLEVVTGQNAVTYHWWCELPDEWGVLQPAVDWLTRLVRRGI